MEIPDSPRLDYCYKRAHDLLVEYEITSFPVDPIMIIRDCGFIVDSYANVAQKKGTTISDICSRFHTNVAITFYDSKNYYVFYNNTLSNNYMRFSLMHELGHIYLGHLRDFEKTSAIPSSQYLTKLSRKENKVLELEADSFAGNVLLPLWSLNHFDVLVPEILSKFYGVTPSCGKKRISVIDEDTNSSYESGCHKEDIQLSKLPIYGLGCTTCGYISILKEHYCPICGNPLKKGNVKSMKYPMLNTYDNGKLKECPICKNEETSIEGDYCQICGYVLKNYCQNTTCAKSVPSNARFCPSCGTNTFFSFYNFLPSWDKDPIRQPVDTFFGFPNGIEEELPFN